MNDKNEEQEEEEGGKFLHTFFSSSFFSPSLFSFGRCTSVTLKTEKNRRMYQLYYPESKQKSEKNTQNAIEHLSSGYHWHHHHFHTHSLIKPRPNKYFSFFFFFSSLLHLVGSIRLTLQRCCRRPSQWSGVSPHRSRFFFFFWQSHWTRYYARDWMQCDRVWRMVPWCSVRAWRDFLRFTLPG